MQNRTLFKSSLALALSGLLAFGSTAAIAQHGGGGHAIGGFHGGGYGGYHGGGYGYRAGYGYHGGYGYRGYGYRGGYYGYGWGLGLGLGLYFATLPLYYSTLWWEGVPYYYADNTYYRYDGAARQYQTVAPPEGLVSENATQSPVGTDLMAYPKNGQSEEQQKQDKYECHHWATTQSGFDPTQGAAPSGSAGKRTDYMRAQEACLEGRGYTVK